MSSNHFNELKNESSPYLLQHANNPVNWLAWNEKSWQKAVNEDKLVIVSIGYSACHWCHVMEHESFEDKQVAEIMNEHFISIKVDREERPDVDQIYMDAVQLIRGQGGWPLNAITLPNGKPVYAGTYFPKENWKQVLLYFVNEKQHHSIELNDRANEITEGIVRMDGIYHSEDNVNLLPEIRNQMLLEFTKNFDVKFGGRAGAPKFVMPDNYRFLLQLYRSSGFNAALEMVKTTLMNISLSGLNDQVGGGFCRYSVDAYWNIPHFEKMLYDNAQLMSLFADAYRISKEPEYLYTVEQIFSFLKRELLDEEGGFYSALDADSEGEEGKFYVWSWEELNELLGTEIELFRKYYDCSQQGNFEGHNHLARRGSVAVLSERWGETEENVSKNIQRWMNMLFEKREKRVRPGLDDKILTSWNALMITGLADAFLTFKDDKFKVTAMRCANFITTKCIDEQDHLFRTYKQGNARIHGFLDDYALSMEAFIKVFQMTADEKWLIAVQKLLLIVMDEFWDENSGFFYYTSRLDPALIARKKEMSDNVISSSNAVMADMLYVMGQLFYNEHYLNVSKKMVLAMQEMYNKHPVFYSRWAKVADYWIDEPQQLIVAGDNALDAQLKLYEENRNALIFPCLGESEIPAFSYKFQKGETLMYVCKDKSCGAPEVLG